MKKGEPFRYRQAEVYAVLRKRGSMTAHEVATAIGVARDAVIQVLIRGRKAGCFALRGLNHASRWEAVPRRRPRRTMHPESLNNLAWGSPWAGLEKAKGYKVGPRPKPAIELERTWGWGV